MKDDAQLKKLAYAASPYALSRYTAEKQGVFCDFAPVLHHAV